MQGPCSGICTGTEYSRPSCPVWKLLLMSVSVQKEERMAESGSVDTASSDIVIVHDSSKFPGSWHSPRSRLALR